MPTKRFHSTGASGGLGPRRRNSVVGFELGRVWAGTKWPEQAKRVRLRRHRRVRVTGRMIADTWASLEDSSGPGCAIHKQKEGAANCAPQRLAITFWRWRQIRSSRGPPPGLEM